MVPAHRVARVALASHRRRVTHAKPAGTPLSATTAGARRHRHPTMAKDRRRGRTTRAIRATGIGRKTTTDGTVELQPVKAKI